MPHFSFTKRFKKLQRLQLPGDNTNSVPVTVVDLKILVDQPSLTLFPDDISKELYPLQVHADGNCLAVWASLCAYGDEARHPDIKILLAREKIINQKYYLDTCKKYAMYCEFCVAGMNARKRSDLINIY